MLFWALVAPSWTAVAACSAATFAVSKNPIAPSLPARALPITRPIPSPCATASLVLERVDRPLDSGRSLADRELGRLADPADVLVEGLLELRVICSFRRVVLKSWSVPARCPSVVLERSDTADLQGF